MPSPTIHAFLGGDDDVLGERAVRVDAQDPQVPADVSTSGPAGRATPACDVRLGGDEHAPPDVVHLGADRLDRPGDLVTERHGTLGIRPSAHSFQS